MTLRIGAKSLLIGVHQVLWHPLTVIIAWWRLYGRPSWPELVCIVIHDWGYWSAPNMDGQEGERHPEMAAKLAGKWFCQEYHDLCLYHSRHYARNTGAAPSRLCWADKLSIAYDPWWFYLARAWLSGELMEYRRDADRAGLVPLTEPHRVWFRYIRAAFILVAKERDPQAMPYVNFGGR